MAGVFLRIIGNPGDDDDVIWLIHWIAVSNHRADLSFDEVSLNGVSVACANGYANAREFIILVARIYDKVWGSKAMGFLYDGIKLLVLSYPVNAFHKWPNRGKACRSRTLVGDLRSSFGSAAGQDLTAIMVIHSGAEASLVGVLHFRRLIGFSHTLSPPSFTSVRIDYRFSPLPRQ